MINKTIGEFTELLAAKTSVPGGGGASALIGSIGIALGSMVGQFTLGKKKYADFEDDIKSLMAKADDIRIALNACIDEDAIAFEPLSKAYGMPKDAPDRDEIMEKCLRDAAAVPFKILQLACEAVDLQKGFLDKGSSLMITDAGTGAAALQAAIKGASLNVKINTKFMKDRQYAAELNDKVDELVDDYLLKAETIYWEAAHVVSVED
jgi:formiminotetrahydrofolate cyclodeaminase